MSTLVKHYCDCDHLRMEPGAPLYQRETVYMAADVDAQRAAMTGPGSPYTRWQRLMEELENRFPDPRPYESSRPAEARYLKAIDGLLAQLAASQSRCAQLVDALGEIAPFAGSWLEETYGDTYTTHSSWIKVRQALTSTERPPA